MKTDLIPTEKTNMKILGTGLKGEVDIELLMLEEDYKKVLYTTMLILIIVMFVNFFV